MKNYINYIKEGLNGITIEEVIKMCIETENYYPLLLLDNNDLIMKYILKNKLLNIELTKFIIENKFNLNLKDNYGRTELILSSLYNHKDIVELLINASADLNLKDNAGNTALILVSLYNNKDIAELLINAGADLNLKNNAGYTALI